MTNLEPDTKYSYKVGNDEHGWSNAFDFKSAPNTPQTVNFVAFGDQDISQAAHNTSFFVKKEVEENDSAFTLHFGDLGYARYCHHSFNIFRCPAPAQHSNIYQKLALK